MAMRRFLTSALAMAAAVAAAPTGRPAEKRDLITLTLTETATHTAVISYDTTAVPTETVTLTRPQVVYPDAPKVPSFAFDPAANCHGAHCGENGGSGSKVSGSKVSGSKVSSSEGSGQAGPGLIFPPDAVSGCRGPHCVGNGGPGSGPGSGPVNGCSGSGCSEGPSYPVPGGSGGSALHGISWAVFRKDSSCKTKEQIHDDLKRFEGSYSVLRTYGTECDQVSHAYSWSKNSNMKLFIGIYNLDDIQGEAQKIIDGVNRDWDKVDTIGVGNEHVNFHKIEASRAVSALKQVRQIFRAAGYQGPVVIVDTFAAVKEHPELCDESDYCAINAHAFFDGSYSAEEAGTWLSNTINDVKSKLADANQRIVVCETGWPHKGDTNRHAVPGISQQQAAIAAIKGVFTDNPKDLILFSGYDDPWKKEEPATFNAEPYWGINGAKSNFE